VLSEGRALSLGTAFLPCAGEPPVAFFLGERELEEAGAEGYRLQEQLDDNAARNHYTEYYRRHGRTNGTVVACRRMLGRSAASVGSVLLFADPSAPSALPCRALGILDSCYPDAVKAGLVAAASAEAPGLSLALGGRFGGVKHRGVLALLLPGKAETATSLVGCEAFGPVWEVYDAETKTGRSVIRTIADPSGERDDDGRLLGLPAGSTLGAALQDSSQKSRGPPAGESLWVGIPRVPLWQALRKAPGTGEWALFRGGAVTAEGYLVLEGPGPGAEGVGGAATEGGRTISRLQAFRTRAEHGALGHLRSSYELERLARSSAATGVSAATTVRPYATLVLGGGEGPRCSLEDESLFSGLGLGLAVLGAPGLALSEVSASDAVRDWGRQGPPPQRATLVHRQAVALVMLFPSGVQDDPP